VKATAIPYIEEKFKGQITIEYRDVSDIENYKLMLGLEEKHALKIDNILPVFYLEGRFLNGQGQLAINLERFIMEGLARPKEKEKPYLPTIDLIAYFKSFAPAAVVGAGLVDGINPCAFTVIVFFMSFLALQGYRRRELLVIGLTFIFAVFVTYVCIGLGLFSFLYRLEGFILVSRIANILIGIFSIILGICAVYDMVKFRKTKDTQGLILQLPQAIKNRIHYVVGLHYRKHSGASQGIEAGILRLLLSALSTGFLVSILEAVCTGQTYLPTITFVLKTPHLKLHALAYLVIYNLMFIIPLLIVFSFSLFGTTSEQFSDFLKRHLFTAKILMAVVFFGLGIALLYSQLPQKVPKAAKSAPTSNIETLDSSSWDFGSIKEGDIVKHNFIFKNESKKVLTIKDVNTSCGCAVSQVEKKVLKPGEATTIEVQFNSRGYSGEIKQYIYVYTDDLDNPVARFIIKASVAKL